MGLLLIKLEKADNDFYESLIEFISDHGYKPKVIVHNTDSLLEEVLEFKKTMIAKNLQSGNIHAFVVGLRRLRIDSIPFKCYADFMEFVTVLADL